jgi:hypothetical protein
VGNSVVKEGITMRTMMFLVLVMTPVLVMAQADQEEDIWAPLRPLVGEWEGTGAAGKSQVEAKYTFVLKETFVEAWHRAVFVPDEKNPEGEVHEDRGFMSYDHHRKTIVYRQFHIEGFVNQYVLDSLSSDGTTFIFVSEAIENAPAGTRAREVFSFVTSDQLQTEFHVAWPDQDFQCYSRNELKRKR